jgi:hypothetical protein
VLGIIESSSFAGEGKFKQGSQTPSTLSTILTHGGKRIMDTSPEYAKMCEKAEEIQKLWEPVVGDFVRAEYVSIIREYGISSGASIFPLFTRAGKWAWYNKEDMVWLPRQDQLQDMIDDEYQKISKFWRFVDFLKSPYDKRSHQNTWVVWTNMNGENAGSQEQLWLAFVMREKFGKTWNGEDWEKVNQ